MYRYNRELLIVALFAVLAAVEVYTCDSDCMLSKITELNNRISNLERELEISKTKLEEPNKETEQELFNTELKKSVDYLVNLKKKELEEKEQQLFNGVDYLVNLRKEEIEKKKEKEIEEKENKEEKNRNDVVGFCVLGLLLCIILLIAVFAIYINNNNAKTISKIDDNNVLNT